MKLYRVKDSENILPLIEIAGAYYTLETIIPDIDTHYLTEKLLEKIEAVSEKDLKKSNIIPTKENILPPMGGVRKIVCIGLNSLKHIEEMKLETPTDPTFFMKATSSICGAYTPIEYQSNMKKVDWEAELAIVIGKKGKNIPKANAFEHILGYTCLNDISERYWQFEMSGGQYTKGKSFDTFAPLGPSIALKNSILNPQNLQVTLQVNEIVRQNFNTNDYLFKIDEIISYLSQLFTLELGDVISMGTGNGVAKYWNESYLHPGDTVRLEIEGIGVQENLVKKV